MIRRSAFTTAASRERRSARIHPDPTHSPMLGLKLAEKLKETGVEVVYHSNTEPNTKLPNAERVSDRVSEEVNRLQPLPPFKGGSGYRPFNSPRPSTV